MARVSNEVLANVLLENVQKLENNTSKICKVVDQQTEKLLNTNIQIDVTELKKLQSDFEALIQETNRINNHTIEQIKEEYKKSYVWYKWITFCIGFAFIGIFGFIMAFKYSVDTEYKIRQNIEADHYIIPKKEYSVARSFLEAYSKDFELYKAKINSN